MSTQGFNEHILSTLDEADRDNLVRMLSSLKDALLNYGDTAHAMATASVITSYSIHYTKLYDDCAGARDDAGVHQRHRRRNHHAAMDAQAPMRGQ